MSIGALPSLKTTIWEQFHSGTQLVEASPPIAEYELNRFLNSLDSIITNETSPRINYAGKKLAKAPVFQSLDALYFLNRRRSNPIPDDQIKSLNLEIAKLDPILSELYIRSRELHYLITHYHKDARSQEKFVKLVNSARPRYEHDNFERDLQLFIYKFGLDDPSIKRPRTVEELQEKMGPEISLSASHIKTMQIIFEMLFMYKNFEDSPGNCEDYTNPNDGSISNNVLQKIGKSTVKGSYQLYHLVLDSCTRDLAREELLERLESVKERYQERRFDPIAIFLFKLGLETPAYTTAIKSDTIVANKFHIDLSSIEIIYDRVIKLLLDPNASIKQKIIKTPTPTATAAKPLKVKKTKTPNTASVESVKDSVQKFNSAYYNNGTYNFNAENNEDAKKHFCAILEQALEFTCPDYNGSRAILFPNELKGLSNDEVVCIYPSLIDDLLIRSYGFLSPKLEPLRTSLGFETNFKNLTQKLFGVVKVSDSDAIKKHIQELNARGNKYFLEQYIYIRRQISTINKFIGDPKSFIYKCHIGSIKRYAKQLLIALFSSSNNEDLTNYGLDKALDKIRLTRPSYRIERNKLQKLFEFAKFGFQNFSSSEESQVSIRLMRLPTHPSSPHVRERAGEMSFNGFEES